jgi:hypothetical protein
MATALLATLTAAGMPRANLDLFIQYTRIMAVIKGNGWVN